MKKTILSILAGIAMGALTTIYMIGTIEIYTPEDILYLDMFGNIKTETGNDIQYSSYKEMREQISNISSRYPETTDHQMSVIGTHSEVTVTDGEVYLILYNPYTQNEYAIELTTEENGPDFTNYSFTGISKLLNPM